MAPFRLPLRESKPQPVKAVEGVSLAPKVSQPGQSLAHSICPVSLGVFKERDDEKPAEQMFNNIVVRSLSIVSEWAQIWTQVWLTEWLELEWDYFR